MNFSKALEHLKAGRRTRRPGKFWVRLENYDNTLLGKYWVAEGPAGETTSWVFNVSDHLAEDWEVENAPTPILSEFSSDQSCMIFSGANHQEILRITSEGNLLVKGKLVKCDEELLQGFKEFFTLMNGGVVLTPERSEIPTRFARILGGFNAD
jgi:hypothetical protein